MKTLAMIVLFYGATQITITEKIILESATENRQEYSKVFETKTTVKELITRLSLPPLPCGHLAEEVKIIDNKIWIITDMTDSY